MPGAVFGAGRGAAYVALSSGPRDAPQRVLVTPTRSASVPQHKLLPHTQQTAPPVPCESQLRKAESLWGSTALNTLFLGHCRT